MIQLLLQYLFLMFVSLNLSIDYEWSQTDFVRFVFDLSSFSLRQALCEELAKKASDLSLENENLKRVGVQFNYMHPSYLLLFIRMRNMAWKYAIVDKSVRCI